MLDPIRQLFSADGFMPHGMCYLWQPAVLGLHLSSDALITLAYFSIPFTLLQFVRRRKDLEFNWIFVCFAIFIVACGTTHLMDIVTVWQPVYWLSGTIKAITALASVPTAVLLVKLMPEALRLPSPSALRLANEQLEREIGERTRAESEVRRVNSALEARVAERTAELEAVNRSLLHEIEQRHQAERTVRANQRLMQTVLDNSTAVIYVKDLQFRYLLANRRFEEIFNLSRDTVIGSSDYDLFSPEAAEAFRAMDQRVLSSDRSLTEEETVPQADGSHTYLSVKAPLRDDSGEVTGVFGISTDITERKQAELHLRAQLERMRLLDRITRAIGERQDLRSTFEAVIRSLEENLPIDFVCIGLYEPSRNLLEIASVGGHDQALALDPALSEQTRLEVDPNGLGRCVQGQLVYEPDISGSEFPFLSRLARCGLRALVVAPLSVENKVFGVLLAARRTPNSFRSADCEFLRQLSEHLALATHQTQLRSALQQAYDDLRQTQQSIMEHERLRALGQMASGIAHDINNALSPAALYAQSLLEREPSLSRQARAYLTVIQRAIETVSGTVARLREFYRPRERDFETVPLDVNALLMQVAELTRVRWSDMPQEHGFVIQLHTELASERPMILGIEHEIRDALTNLVLNAVDAMPAGGTLTLRSRTTDRQTVAVEIGDSGVGMSEEVRRRCLEPFFTTKGDRGTGLGMAMVYGSVQRHRGELAIDSTPGRGTTVRLSFPTAPAQHDTLTHDLAGAVPPLRLLVVDDDPMLLRSLRDILEADGHEVFTAAGGQAGIDEFLAAVARSEPYAAVITDLGMPNVDGRAVASVAKASAPGTPIVLLTGWGHRLQGENMPEYVDRVLSKPPRLPELRAALAEIAAAQIRGVARSA